ncbi:hypothetical protein D8674_022269 [Pyrus ussuriensis x Pyrus communis]|uniref:Aminotransferase-like plant mobile domain-containing protein n=1 Tax=Pyrus ussuriensis x Pyrus communis TaxID=2448454 RepID=A0A5N5GP86_9ROSA|nr:hypothetical protein D8674_022269 [Pyrus ussuriensis x Pyrus communis]
MEDPEESVVEEREELMVPPSGGNPFLRKAYFLKPPLQNSSTDEPLSKLPPFSSSFPSHFELQKWPLKVEFHGWTYGQKDWKTWIDQMASVHRSTWKKAGIYEAIINSTYKIRRQTDLVFGFVEKWCSETNTFSFPWGETTITLEDVMVLGGFSVLGDSVLCPLEISQLKEIHEKLLAQRRQIARNKGNVTTQIWQKKFMNSGSEIEHEAFLVFWLCSYVFVSGRYRIHNDVFSVAIHLARGTRIALAPAVLASIYRDLGVLKMAIVDSNKLEISSNDVLELVIRSPFQLVQVWAWERFSDLRPENPSRLNCGEPRMARWDTLNGQKEKWVSVGPASDDELQSFVRCLRVSELVGLNGTIEQYLPHRVAMQFGYDQDLPCSLTQLKHNSNTDWKHYVEETKKVKLYLPSRLFEADVSTNYLKWWNQSVSGHKDACGAAVPQKKRSKTTQSRKSLLLSTNHPSVPPGFPHKHKGMEAEEPMDEEDKLTISEVLKYRKKHESGGIRQSSDREKLSGQAHNSASPVAEESSVTMMTSNEGNVSIVGNGCAISSSLFDQQLRELKARCTRLESMVRELKADSFERSDFWTSF